MTGLARRALVLLHQPGPAAVRLRPALRPVRRADGVPRRARHGLGPGARRPDPRCRPSSTSPLQFTNDYLSEIVLGVLFLVVILLLPRGVIPTAGEKIASWRAHGAPGRAAARACRRAAPAGPRRTAARRDGELRAPRRRARAGPDREVRRGDRAAAGRAGVQGVRRRAGAQRLHDRGGARAASPGLIGPNGSGKTTLFNVITGYERVDAGDVYAGRQEDHERAAAAGVRPRHRPDLPADQDLPAADGHGEHAGRRPASRPAAGCRNPLARAGGARRPAARHGPAGVHRDRRARDRAGRHPVLRPAQAARAVLRAGRRPRDRAARRAGRRREPVPDPAHRGPDPRAERRAARRSSSSSTTWIS